MILYGVETEKQIHSSKTFDFVHFSFISDLVIKSETPKDKFGTFDEVRMESDWHH
jgi:hypothetical protein